MDLEGPFLRDFHVDRRLSLARSWVSGADVAADPRRASESEIKFLAGARADAELVSGLGITK